MTSQVDNPALQASRTSHNISKVKLSSAQKRFCGFIKPHDSHSVFFLNATKT